MSEPVFITWSPVTDAAYQILKSISTDTVLRGRDALLPLLCPHTASYN